MNCFWFLFKQRYSFFKLKESLKTHPGIARLSYIVYCNAEDFEFGTCLGSPSVSLLKNHGVARDEMFTLVGVLKSVGAQMRMRECNVKLSKFLFHNLFVQI